VERKTGLGDGSSGAIDAVAMLQYESSNPNISLFLEARDKLQRSNAAFAQALDEIHGGLKADSEAIVRAFFEFHYKMERDCLSTEETIAYDIKHNARRRVEYRLTLEQSARKAQGLFAGLLSKLFQ